MDDWIILCGLAGKIKEPTIVCRDFKINIRVLSLIIILHAAIIHEKLHASKPEISCRKVPYSADWAREGLNDSSFIRVLGAKVFCASYFLTWVNALSSKE